MKLKKSPLNPQVEVHTPRKKGRPKEINTVEDKVRQEKLADDIFLFYFAGKTPTEICEIFNISHPTFYRIKDRYNFDVKRKELEGLARMQAEQSLIKSRIEQMRMLNTIVTIACSSILKQYQEGKLKVGFSDVLTAIKSYQLMMGNLAALPDEYNFTNINVMNNTNVVTDRQLMDEIFDSMTPEQQAIMVEVNKKISEVEAKHHAQKMKLLD